MINPSANKVMNMLLQSFFYVFPIFPGFSLVCSFPSKALLDSRSPAAILYHCPDAVPLLVLLLK